MTDYELTFIIAPVTDPQADRLMETYDCLIGRTHSGDEFVTITASHDNAVDAAKGMHMRLLADGVHVLRLEPDLVTRREIADRLQVTPQAVGQWIRGERHRGFPRAYHDVAGGVWLWTDVVAWVRNQLGTDPAPGFEFPSRTDFDEFNACLERGYEEAPMPLIMASVVPVGSALWIGSVLHQDGPVEFVDENPTPTPFQLHIVSD